MSSQAVIRAEGLSKRFQIYRKPIDILKEALVGGVRHDTFWALRDVSFEVREKQRVGIIGPNGAGKSTLLQVITGNLQPTSGSILVDGRISALLSLTPSWNLEESGVENIRFNLLLQGCDPKVIPEMIEEIIDFTELGAFIYQPVKTYSSGMSSRLSFAIATAMQPDILIIDEVLATGDAYFVGKAYRRMQDLCDRGRALLFVSHSTDAVARLCDVVIWMQDGSIREMGPAEQVLKLYEADYRKREDESLRAGNVARAKALGNTASVEDLLDMKVLRIRLVPKHGEHLHNTHYVRRVTMEGLGADGASVDVPLTFVDFASDDFVAGLDVVGCEWGRLFERQGELCRTLARSTGRTAGGQIVMRMPLPDSDGFVDVSGVIECMSPMPHAESLTIQVLDPATGAWREAENVTTVALGNGWKRLSGRIRVSVVSEEEAQVVREKVEVLTRSRLDIIETFMVVDGERTGVGRERQPFSIGVTFTTSELIPVLDVGIRILRADGNYVFWQSTGFDSENLRDMDGTYTVFFHFDPNMLGQGEYSVLSYAANGWDFEENYPYSEVFARETGALVFKIRPEREGLDMGQLNVRVRTEVRKC